MSSAHSTPQYVDYSTWPKTPMVSPWPDMEFQYTPIPLGATSFSDTGSAVSSQSASSVFTTTPVLLPNTFSATFPNTFSSAANFPDEAVEVDEIDDFGFDTRNIRKIMADRVFGKGTPPPSDGFSTPDPTLPRLPGAPRKDYNAE